MRRVCKFWLHSTYQLHAKPHQVKQMCKQMNTWNESSEKSWKKTLGKKPLNTQFK